MLKEKEEREIRLKRLMCKVTYYQLKKAASTMIVNFELPEKNFDE